MSLLTGGNRKQIFAKIGIFSWDDSLSNYIRSLKLGKMMKYEYVPEFQSALYAPKPLATLVGER